MSMSLCRITTSPASAAKSSTRSSAGLVRLAVSPATFDETNSLWMLNSPMPEKTPGNVEQHAADVIDGVHVRRIEAGDHRIEARLLGRGQRLVDAGDVGVGERVVVERRVALQVVGRREVARIGVRPVLLERNAEQRRSADPVAHDLAGTRCDVDALLDVVRQVEVRVVELVGGTLALCVERPRAGREDREQGQRDRGAEDGRRTGRRSASHLHLRVQKLISRLMWNTGPLAPTG